MKSQTVRLVDVFLIGPYLLYIANREKQSHHKIILGLTGLATIVYNGKNYLQNIPPIQDAAQAGRTASIGVRG